MGIVIDKQGHKRPMGIAVCVMVRLESIVTQPQQDGGVIIGPRVFLGVMPDSW